MMKRKSVAVGSTALR